MRIQHNIMAMNAYRNYSNNTSALSKNLEKLSSGYRINRAGDDAAGLAISEKMRAQITGLETAQKNAKDGISLVQTAEGALTEVHDMLNRMVELADQSANGTYDNEVDRANLQKELDQLREEVDRIADSANFNGIKLLNGHLSDAVGVTSTQGGEVAGTGLESILGGNGVTTITEGKLTAGTEEKQAGAHIYMGDKLQASVTLAGTTNTSTKFELVLGNGNGGSVTITFTMATGSSALGSTAEVDMSDILLAIQNTADTDTAISGASVSGGMATVAIAGKINGTTANLEDVFDLYDISMDGEQLKITAKATASITGMGTIKAEDLSVKISVEATADDKAAMEAGIKADLDGDGTGNAPADVKLGSSSWGQEHGVSANPAEYTKASMVVTMKSGASIESGSAIKIGDMTYVMLKQNEELTDELKAFVSAGGASVKVVTFDASKANGAANAGSAAYELMRAINAGSSSTSVFAASVDTNGNLVLQETEDYAKKVIADANSANPTSKPDALGTLLKDGKIGDSDYTYGAEGKKNQITFSGTGEKGLQVGTTLEIGGKTYEFATSADKVKEGHEFIQFTAGDNDANAKALADALNEDGITAAVVDNADGDPMVQFALDTKVGDLNCKGLTLQIGDTSDDYNQLTVLIDATDCESLGIDASKVSIADQTSAADAVDILKEAINKVSSIRGTLGATQNRLDHTINNLSVMTENIQDAESTIRDTDVADEMMAYTKNNILIQSAQAMLAQANQVPQGVLQLLQ